MLRTPWKSNFLQKSALNCKFFASRQFSDGESNIPEYNVVYRRPESVKFCDKRRTGDLGLDHGVKTTDFLAFHAKSAELNGASELVKRSFTLEYQPRKETVKARGESIMARVKRHRLDRGSPEVKIAALTNEIHQLLEVYENNKQNKLMKTFLKEMIDKRAQVLRHLRTWDYKRFEWILERMNIVYKPFPTAPKVVGRKGALRVLTEQYCDEVVSIKMHQYRETLDKQKVGFYQDMAAKLRFIMEQEAQYGLHKSVTQEDVDRVLENAKIAARKLENRA